jgi:hypothetical protein
MVVLKAENIMNDKILTSGFIIGKWEKAGNSGRSE